MSTSALSQGGTSSEIKSRLTINDADHQNCERGDGGDGDGFNDQDIWIWLDCVQVNVLTVLFSISQKSLICLSRMLSGVALCMCYRTSGSAAQEAPSSTPGLPPGSEGDWDTDLCSLMETKLFLGHTGECGVGGCVRVNSHTH